MLDPEAELAEAMVQADPARIRRLAEDVIARADARADPCAPENPGNEVALETP